MGFWGTITSIMQAPAKWTAQGIGSVIGGNDDFERFANRLEKNEDSDSWGGAINSIIDPTSTTNAFAAGTGKIMPSWMKEGAFPALVDMIAAYLYGYPGVMATSGLASQFRDEDPDKAWTTAAAKGATAYAGGELFGGGGGSSAGTGDFDPVTGEEIMSSANSAYGSGWSITPKGGAGTGDFDPITGEEILSSPGYSYGEGYAGETTGKVMDVSERVAKNYAKKFLLNSLDEDPSFGGVAPNRKIDFSGITGETGFPSISEKLEDAEDALDKVFKETGETGDIQTALMAAEAFQLTATQVAGFEREILKYSGDPDFDAIEPQLRIEAEIALRQGMSPQEATAYAFEKAKKERAFSEFLTEFKMRKKLEAAA